MSNQKIAKIFYELADYYEMDGNAIPFKPQAYRKAAAMIESLKSDIGEVYQRGGIEALMEIPGVGEGIAKKIEEYIKTGKIKEYEKFKKKIPIDLDNIVKVEGMGVKKAKILYEKLGIKNLKDLEKAAKAHKIAPLFGFGEKTEKNILENIEFLKRSKGRFLLGEISPIVDEIISKFKNFKIKPSSEISSITGEVKKISEAGSLRRRKETIGDADILIASNNPSKIINYFISLPGIAKILGKGTTKVSVKMAAGFDVDIRVVSEKSFGSALQYFTGSKEHNIVLRKIAISKGLKLNEYGLFKGNKMIAGENEENIYKLLGLNYIEPELRENTGEIEAATNKKLPKLINYNDILGDLHIHSNWDGGENFIEELARTAIFRGYQYIGISDHTQFLKIENGLDEKQLEKRNKEIDKINLKFKTQNLKFRILKGCEANIMTDGSIDIKDEFLAKLDYVIAGVHSQLKISKEEMTQRIVKAMENPNVDIISHLTGRILNQRDEYEFDFDKILSVAKKTGTILEINANPYRLDLNDKNIRRAKKAGVKMIINSDAHHKEQMSQMEYGVFQARRGWAEKSDIINAWPVEKLLNMLK